MSTELQTGIYLHVATDFRGEVVGSGSLAIGRPRDVLNLTVSEVLTNGSAADEADLVYRTAGSLAAEGTVSINPQDGSLEDAFGQAIQMQGLVFLVVCNDATDATAILTVSGTMSGAMPSSIRPGGFAVVYAPDVNAISLADATTLTLTNASDSAAAPYRVLAVGRSSAPA